MKRFFALITVIASSAILFSCGDSSSDDDSLPALSAENKAVVTVINQAVSEAVNNAMGPATSPALKAEEPGTGFPYGKAGDPVYITGSYEDMTIVFTKYETTTKDAAGTEHKIVMNGTLHSTETFDTAAKSQIYKRDGEIDVVFDSVSHKIGMKYTKTVTHDEATKTLSFVITGTITFDGVENKYEDSGKED
jgi:hypothetical protein